RGDLDGALHGRRGEPSGLLLASLLRRARRDRAGARPRVRPGARRRPLRHGDPRLLVPPERRLESRTHERAMMEQFRRAGALLVGCAALILVSGSYRVPSGVPRGVGYFTPAAYANAVAQGTIRLTKTFDWSPVPGMGGADDMGYPIARQFWLLAGGDGSEATI